MTLSQKCCRGTVQNVVSKFATNRDRNHELSFPGLLDWLCSAGPRTPFIYRQAKWILSSSHCSWRHSGQTLLLVQYGSTASITDRREWCAKLSIFCSTFDTTPWQQLGEIVFLLSVFLCHPSPVTTGRRVGLLWVLPRFWAWASPPNLSDVLHARHFKVGKYRWTVAIVSQWKINWPLLGLVRVTWPIKRS